MLALLFRSETAMSTGFLLSRILLRFEDGAFDRLGELSAVAMTADGSLWVGSDELTTLERLSPLEPGIYGQHQAFNLGDFVDLSPQKDEIDIEGLDGSGQYLWLVGSHSTKRKKAKGKKPAKDIERLAEVKTEANRYLLARIPVLGGELCRSVSDPDDPERVLTAAWLQKTEETNLLLEALAQDPHLSPFVRAGIPSKENGLDIEGLAVHGDRLFLGLRGPVLGRWAMLLELEVEAADPQTLVLKAIGREGQPYKKHFVDLNGLGVRELCWAGDDLLILAGPTMDLEGSMQVFRLQNAVDLEQESVSAQESGGLEVVFDLNFTLGSDHAEGLALVPCLGEESALLIVYDSPDPRRLVAPDGVFADVFRL